MAKVRCPRHRAALGSLVPGCRAGWYVQLGAATCLFDHVGGLVSPKASGCLGPEWSVDTSGPHDGETGMSESVTSTVTVGGVRV